MEMNVPAYKVIREKEDNILEIIPFNSGRKRATTAVRLPKDQNKVRVFCKGAPEIVIEYCNSTFDS
jgi:magnesium-transporting ATPase (P-type)